MRSSRIRTTVVGCIALASLTLVSVSSGGASRAAPLARSSAGSTPVIGISVKTLTNDPFQAAWVASAQKELAKLGAKADLLTAGGETATAKQVSQIENMITAHVNGLIIDPIDGSAVVPALVKAKAAKIPVVVVDSAVAAGHESLYQTFIATDNVQAAYEAATYLAGRLGATGKVAIIEGAAGSIPGEQRTQGFEQGLKAKGLKPVAEAAGNWDDSTAFKVMQNILTAQPDLNGALVASDVMIDGVLQALTDAHKTGVSVAAIDGSKVGIQAVISGKLAADNTQNPNQMGTLGAKDIVGMVHGTIKLNSLPKFINSGTVTVTKANAQAALALAFG
jgi:ABC-type sugar transport system substrate-binding protein